MKNPATHFMKLHELLHIKLHVENIVTYATKMHRVYLVIS